MWAQCSMSQETVTAFMEKAEVFSALVLSGKNSVQQSQASEMCEKDWKKILIYPQGNGGGRYR